MITITPLVPADRAAWERLFRGYIAFYERDEPQAMYDLAWAEFMAGERLHALGARMGPLRPSGPLPPEGEEKAEGPSTTPSARSPSPLPGEELVGITHFFVHPS